MESDTEKLGKEEKVLRRNRKCSITKIGKNTCVEGNIVRAFKYCRCQRNGERVGVSGFKRRFTQGPVCNELTTKLETLGKKIIY